MTTILRSAAALSACLLAVAAVPSHAQQPASSADVPVLNCTNPGFPPLDRASPEMGRFQKRVDAYKVCVNDYTKTVGAKSNELAAQAQVYSDAANKAIDDYNTYVTSLNEKTKSTKSSTGDKN